MADSTKEGYSLYVDGDAQVIMKEGNILFNDALNTFKKWLYGIGHMVKDHSDREETHYYHYMGYSFRLAAKDLL